MAAPPRDDTTRAADAPVDRRLAVGAEVQGTGTHFCVWAPWRKRVTLVLDGDGAEHELRREKGGYFAAFVPGVETGARYRFRVDGGQPLPDPASRFQPEGPHGPSEVVDPEAFAWTDAGWRGVALRDAVIYEMHVGTFTPAGTWDGARALLPRLAELGVNVLEVMPVADFPGRFGWGYDGVNWFAPTRLYGRPDDFRRFVDAAHGLGLAVVLDVVYNHLGPDGNYLRFFADEYFSTRHRTEWGEALNFDDDGAQAVRELVIANVRHWIGEYHLDGLRLDATQSLFDDSEEHVLSAIVRAARSEAGARTVLVIGENEPQEVRLLRSPAAGGHGLDALWNDDFHHSATVALTGRREAYYTDYMGTAQEFVSATRHGFLFQGQRYAWQKQRRGTPAFGVDPAAFVTFLENHDQTANSARGLRCHQTTSPGRLRAMTALVLLGPGTPMLFQGQEYATSRPFLYFADHEGDLGRKVAAGRREFLEQFPSIAGSEWSGRLAPPDAEPTFRACVLDPAERDENAAMLAFHRDLLRVRRDDATLRARRVDGAVLGRCAFVLRFFGEAGDDRLLVVNLGPQFDPPSVAEPLLAPPTRAGWELQWSSDAADYGGPGALEPELDGAWLLGAESAVLLRPSRRPLPPVHERRRMPREGRR